MRESLWSLLDWHLEAMSEITWRRGAVKSSMSWKDAAPRLQQASVALNALGTDPKRGILHLAHFDFARLVPTHDTSRLTQQPSPCLPKPTPRVRPTIAVDAQDAPLRTNRTRWRISRQPIERCSPERSAAIPPPPAVHG
jgi:hypothetical protein